MSPTQALTALMDASPMITGVAGGLLALISALLLFVIATALGPDVHVFPCMDARARFMAFLTAFSWFGRGVLLLTGLGGPEGRHPHWDMPISWGMTTALLSIILAYVWAQRMPPEVRERFDRREQSKRERVQDLAANGHIADAKLVAAGGDGAAQFFEVGLDQPALDRLRAQP